MMIGLVTASIWWIDSTPYAVDVAPFLSPIGVPCQQPPFGMVSAVDLRTRKLVWTRPFGTAAGSGPMGLKLGVPLPMGVPNLGGSLVTASGLIFIGASQDEKLRVIDIRTGKELLRTALPAGGQATPMTYKLPGGRQYVVIAAGGYAGLRTRQGDSLIAYTVE